MKHLFLSLPLISFPAAGSDTVASCPAPDRGDPAMSAERHDLPFPTFRSADGALKQLLTANDASVDASQEWKEAEKSFPDESIFRLEGIPLDRNTPVGKPSPPLSPTERLIADMRQKYHGIVTSTIRSSSVITAEIIYAVMWVESKGRSAAANPSGAQGIMQINARTQRHLGLRPGEAFIPKKAIPQAARYLEENYDVFGDWYSAILAYGIGPGGARAYLRKKGDPSRHPYVKKVFRAKSLM